MRSKPVKEESKDELDGDLSEKKTSNRSSEVEPCLTMDNGNDLDKKEANFGSDASLTKGSDSLLESEKGDVYYSESKIDYSKSNSDKKTGFYRFRYECENKIRQKLGLTHGGYLAGLFLLSAVAFLLIVVIVLGACWPRVPHSQSFPICTESACLTSSALVSDLFDSFPKRKLAFWELKMKTFNTLNFS
ncbi:hypothetical protein RUM44_006760 [Polyplax serrata]|uniref:Uncharacterized protein n=1 Tax=Polyplax serrata TaxID=468196 RepID=A0ABR1AJ25_POLSC